MCNTEHKPEKDLVWKMVCAMLAAALLAALIGDTIRDGRRGAPDAGCDHVHGMCAQGWDD